MISGDGPNEGPASSSVGIMTGGGRLACKHARAFWSLMAIAIMAIVFLAAAIATRSCCDLSRCILAEKIFVRSSSARARRALRRARTVSGSWDAGVWSSRRVMSESMAQAASTVKDCKHETSQKHAAAGQQGHIPLPKRVCKLASIYKRETVSAKLHDHASGISSETLPSTKVCTKRNL